MFLLEGNHCRMVIVFHGKPPLNLVIFSWYSSCLLKGDE